MEYSEMRADFLGAARVIDNFIGGVMEPYSYEDYLRDFVNCSMQVHPQRSPVPPDSAAEKPLLRQTGLRCR